jgi:hypothetical protein
MSLLLSNCQIGCRWSSHASPKLLGGLSGCGHCCLHLAGGDGLVTTPTLAAEAASFLAAVRISHSAANAREAAAVDSVAVKASQ